VNAPAASGKKGKEQKDAAPATDAATDEEEDEADPEAHIKKSKKKERSARGEGHGEHGRGELMEADLEEKNLGKRT
jgi:hypothetical protein